MPKWDDMRTRIMEESSAVAVELADKSLQSVETYKPATIVLNIDDLMSLRSQIGKMGSVDVDNGLGMAVSDFKYSVGTSMAQFALKITSDKQPNVATQKTQQCRSVQMQTSRMDGDGLIGDEKEAESSQLSQVSAQQLSDLPSLCIDGWMDKPNMICDGIEWIDWDWRH